MTNLNAKTPLGDSAQTKSLLDHINETLAPTSEYTGRVPSPPAIWVPPPALHGTTATATVSLQDPSLSWAIASLLGLATEDYLVITDSNKPQGSGRPTSQWSYTERHKAHPILDFLYLGPASVARDPGFLKDAGITMVLAVRDTRFPTAFQGALSTAHNSGLATESVVMDQNEPSFGLLRLHVDFARRINQHMLHGEANSWHRSRRRRVLVVCETGNDRSVLMVASYVMVLYGLGVVDVARFVQAQRFCANMTDPYRQALQTLEDLLRAKLDVIRQRGPLGPIAGGIPVMSEWSGSEVRKGRGNKRSAEDEDDEMAEGVRPGNAPYVDHDEVLLD